MLIKFFSETCKQKAAPEFPERLLSKDIIRILFCYIFFSNLVATFNDVDTVFGVSNFDTLEVVVNRSCSVAFD